MTSHLRGYRVREEILRIFLDASKALAKLFSIHAPILNPLPTAAGTKPRETEGTEVCSGQNVPEKSHELAHK